MIIYRHRSGKNFTIVNNHYLDNKELSFKAKGLLTYLLRLPDTWKINIADLVKRSIDGRDSITSAINELINNNYCLRFQVRTEKGQFDSYDYVISDIPLINPNTEKPITVEQLMENPKLLNTNIKISINNNKKSNIKEKNILFEDSIYNENFELFKNELTEKFGDLINYRLYFERVKSWSKSKNTKSYNWIEEISLWIQKDIQQNNDLNQAIFMKEYLQNE